MIKEPLNVYSADFDLLNFIKSLNKRKLNSDRLFGIFGNSVYLDIYSLYILIDQTQNRNKILGHININKFADLMQFYDRLYFVCHIDLERNKWKVDNVIYNTTHKKAFLIKKVISKTLKPIFSDIAFNKQLSESHHLTIFNIII